MAFEAVAVTFGVFKAISPPAAHVPMPPVPEAASTTDEVPVALAIRVPELSMILPPVPPLAVSEI